MGVILPSITLKRAALAGRVENSLERMEGLDCYPGSRVPPLRIPPTVVCESNNKHCLDVEKQGFETRRGY